MKSVKLILSALACVFGAMPVTASTYTASEIIDVGENYTFYNALIAKGSQYFSDSFVFSLGSGVTGAAFLFNIGLPGSPINEFSVTYNNDDIGFIGGNFNNTSTRLINGKTIVSSVLDKVEYTFSLTNLDAGAKSIDIEGSFTKPFATEKSYSLTVTAVPEPDSFALLLAGLGMVAAIARRKSTKH